MKREFVRNVLGFRDYHNDLLQFLKISVPTPVLFKIGLCLQTNVLNYVVMQYFVYTRKLREHLIRNVEMNYRGDSFMSIKMLRLQGHCYLGRFIFNHLTSVFQSPVYLG